MKIAWIGSAYEHLYCVYTDGRTFRLDKFPSDMITGKSYREWTEVAQLPDLHYITESKRTFDTSPVELDYMSPNELKKHLQELMDKKDAKP